MFLATLRNIETNRSPLRTAQHRAPEKLIIQGNAWKRTRRSPRWHASLSCSASRASSSHSSRILCTNHGTSLTSLISIFVKRKPLQDTKHANNAGFSLLIPRGEATSHRHERSYQRHRDDWILRATWKTAGHRVEARNGSLARGNRRETCLFTKMRTRADNTRCITVIMPVIYVLHTRNPVAPVGPAVPLNSSRSEILRTHFKQTRSYWRGPLYLDAWSASCASQRRGIIW